ncbi:MAG: hypothetical protein U1F77_08005 [Kiritimatiellia bacterium]
MTDNAAWIESLVDRHEAPLGRYALSLCGSASLAQDAVQKPSCASARPSGRRSRDMRRNGCSRFAGRGCWTCAERKNRCKP